MTAHPKLTVVAEKRTTRLAPLPEVVLYRLSQYDAAEITALRTTHGIEGNAVQAGESYPALIVRRWTYGRVNLRVMLDGPDDLWAPERRYGDEPGQWRDYLGKDN